MSSESQHRLPALEIRSRRLCMPRHSTRRSRMTCPILIPAPTKDPGGLGYRKGELKALRVSDLDVVASTLRLDDKFTKNRCLAVQPIPLALVCKLEAAIAGKPAESPIFEVNYHLDRLFASDLKAAGFIVKPGEKSLVFHSLRHTYTSLIIESNANVKEAQELLRHSDPRLTIGIYTHVKTDGLKNIVEAVGAKFFKTRTQYQHNRKSRRLMPPLQKMWLKRVVPI